MVSTLLIFICFVNMIQSRSIQNHDVENIEATPWMPVSDVTPKSISIYDIFKYFQMVRSDNEATPWP